MSVIKPSQDSVNRYGQEFADRFVKISAAQRSLMDAYDVLSKQGYNDILDAQTNSECFAYIWELLSEEHKKALAEFDKSRDKNND